jgi:uncharacterized protein
MIHRLRLQNFYSVRDPLELDLTISDYVPERSERYVPVPPGSRTRVPKVIGIYGPNAAGKSNILRALAIAGWIMQHSFQLRPDQPLPCNRFDCPECNDRAVEIEIEFNAPVDLEQIDDASATNCRYVYSVSLGGGTGQPTRVEHEALTYWPPTASRRVKVFERLGDGSVASSRSFQLHGYTKPLKSILRPNASLVSTLVQLGHAQSIALNKIAARIYSNILLERVEYHDAVIAQFYLQRPDLLAGLNREIQRLDLGIKEVVIERPSPGQPPHLNQVKFVHAGLANPLASTSESHGTRQFFRFFPIVAQALETGGIAVVDELDTSIHPLILPEVVRWFYDPARNRRNAQIWFTCQNPYLLTELTKDEIVFCEKDESGATNAFGLRAVKSVRRIDNYAKKYLGGAYGAVPHIG